VSQIYSVSELSFSSIQLGKQVETSVSCVSFAVLGAFVGSIEVLSCVSFAVLGAFVGSIEVVSCVSFAVLGALVGSIEVV